MVIHWDILAFVYFKHIQTLWPAATLVILASISAIIPKEVKQLIHHYGSTQLSIHQSIHSFAYKQVCFP